MQLGCAHGPEGKKVKKIKQSLGIRVVKVECKLSAHYSDDTDPSAARLHTDPVSRKTRG